MAVIYDDKHKLEYEIVPIDKIPIEELVECFRGWVQKVQILSMDNKEMAETQKIAAEVATTMREFTREF